MIANLFLISVWKDLFHWGSFNLFMFIGGSHWSFLCALRCFSIIFANSYEYSLPASAPCLATKPVRLPLNLWLIDNMVDLVLSLNIWGVLCCFVACCFVEILVHEEGTLTTVISLAKRTKQLSPHEGLGVKSRMCPPYPSVIVKGD